MSNQMKQDMQIAYFGGEPIGVPVLEELQACGITPDLIICNPDRPSGRKHVLTPPPVKVWAEDHGIEVFQPESMTGVGPLSRLVEHEWDLFVVVAYNHILPTWLIKLPKHGTINLHPSLLPQYRGPSPIRTAILENNRDAIGVSVMLLDQEMDHGPLLAQKPLPIADEHWPLNGQELDVALARLGGATLAAIIPDWVAGTLTSQAQDHDQATYTKKFTRADGELLIDPQELPRGTEATAALMRIKAFAGWPGTFFYHHNKRIKVIDASIANDTLTIHSVIPEGKSELSFADWLDSQRK